MRARACGLKQLWRSLRRFERGDGTDSDNPTFDLGHGPLPVSQRWAQHLLKTLFSVGRVVASWRWRTHRAGRRSCSPCPSGDRRQRFRKTTNPRRRGNRAQRNAARNGRYEPTASTWSGTLQITWGAASPTITRLGHHCLINAVSAPCRGVPRSHCCPDFPRSPADWLNRAPARHPVYRRAARS